MSSCETHHHGVGRGDGFTAFAHPVPTIWPLRPGLLPFQHAAQCRHNVDRITDFNVADDTILLDNAVFSSNLGLGNISSGEFVIGTAAQDANDRIIYDSNTGALFYDNDGVGGNAQVQFAELPRGLAPTKLDFLVVSGTTQLPSLGGGRLPVTRATTTDLETDSTTIFSRTASVEYVDLNQTLVHQDYLVY